MSPQKQPQNTLQQLSRMVDLKIPLAWMLSGSAVVAWSLVSMYFSMGQLLRDVAELQATMKSGNQQASMVVGELALIKYRVDTLEANKRIESSK